MSSTFYILQSRILGDATGHTERGVINMKDTELLQYVHKTAEMGIKGLEDVEGQIQEEPLREAVGRQVAEYRKIANQAGELLRSHGEEPDDVGLMARLSSEVMSKAKTFPDASPSKIAEMVIQGNTMGITKGIKHLNDYAGDDRQVKELAQRLIATEQDNVEQMKQFL